VLTFVQFFRRVAAAVALIGAASSAQAGETLDAIPLR
jgi:hypothetical protein